MGNESKSVAGAGMMAEDIVEATGTAAFSRGPDGTITSWNGAAEELMSIPAEHVIGRRCNEVIKGVDVFGNDFCGELCNCWRMATSNRLIHPFRLTVTSGDGSRVGLRVSVLPARGASGQELVHLIIVARNGLENTLGSTELEDSRSEIEHARALLTPRELEVLRYLAHGCSTEETAQRLEISTTTVRNHISRSLQKLDAHSRLEAVAIGRRLNLV